jgi:hypothetical protein
MKRLGPQSAPLVADGSLAGMGCRKMEATASQHSYRRQGEQVGERRPVFPADIDLQGR